MQLQHLSLTNFKNIAEASLDFSSKINCLLGNNGMGKSNLLDAIHYMSLCRSFSGVTDALVIRSGEDFMMARGQYIRQGRPEDLQLGVSRGKRKSLRRGGKEYQRMSEHIGLFPLVMAAPQDMDLIRGMGEERRRWMDMVISQTDRPYLEALIRYKSALEQRNRLLRAGIVDHLLYEAIEQQLCVSAAYIHRCRSEWVEELGKLFHTYYEAVAGTAEDVRLSYRGALSASPDGMLQPLLDGARRHDEAVRHTSVGPHRDDIEFGIGEMPLRRSGSQGQCKTFTIALRLAQYQFLHKASGLKPLLLLDDIFDKLDARRVERIVSLVTSDDFGQIFITDTNREHLDHIISRAGKDFRLWEVADGDFTPIEIPEGGI